MTATANLRQQLPELYALQKIDQEIRELIARRRAHVRRIRALDAAREQREAELEAKQQAHTHAQVEQRTRANELASERAKLERFQEQQQNARDANEYTAFAKQIETTTRLVGEREERVIELLIEIDETKDAMDEEAARLAAFMDEYRQERKDILQKIRALDTELAERKRARAAQAERVEADFLDEYGRWTERRTDAMISQVVANVTKEREGHQMRRTVVYTCSECHMTIPAQLMLEARNFSKRYQCPSCHRLLLPPLEDVAAEEDANADA